MYNVSKGGNTLEESEILEPLHACLRELLERERLGKSHLMEYSDDDVIATALLFSHIMGNRLVHNLTDENVSIGMSQKLAVEYGAQIQLLTLSMSGVDLSNAFKDKEQEG